MKVAICEDNQSFARRLELYINNYALMEDNGITVVENTPFSSRIKKLINEQVVDCFFLDIDLGEEISGLELAKIIREHFPLASIIFITTHSEMLDLTFKYQVEALDYIVKDVEEQLHEAVIQALIQAFNKYKKIGEHSDTHYYQIKLGEYVKNIKTDDILYFKSGNVAHKVILYTVNGQFEFYQSLNEIEEVDKNFFRCHRGYVVNLKNIEEINWKNKFVIMKNTEVCPISFRKIKPLKEILKEGIP